MVGCFASYIYDFFSWVWIFTLRLPFAIIFLVMRRIRFFQVYFSFSFYFILLCMQVKAVSTSRFIAFICLRITFLFYFAFLSLLTSRTRANLTNGVWSPLCGCLQHASISCTKNRTHFQFHLHQCSSSHQQPVIIPQDYFLWCRNQMNNLYPLILFTFQIFKFIISLIC